jgi:hypothetical protein
MEDKTFMPILVGPEATDILRREEGNVEPFQSRSQFAASPARIAAFEMFILRSLDLFMAHPGLTKFGLSVTSTVSLKRHDEHFPSIVVSPKVTLIVEGDVRPLVNPQEFYAYTFPFSGVFDGSFALSRDDARVQRYLIAAERKSLYEPARPEDLAERRSVLVLLAADANDAFSWPSLEIEVAVV